MYRINKKNHLLIFKLKKVNSNNIPLGPFYGYDNTLDLSALGGS